MGNNHRFLVSYIADGQPMTIEVEHNSDELTQHQAMGYIRRERDIRSNATITDVQIASEHGTSRPPGHNVPY